MIGTAERVGIAPAAPTAAVDTTAWGSFAAVLCALGAVWLLVTHFSIESEAFARLILLAGAGFAVHYFLPSAWRLPFFGVLSIAGIVLVLGVVPAGWLVAIGLMMMGLCHLPVGFGLRVALIAGVALVLGIVRGGAVADPVPAAVWPILGSMFMFRLAVYLYDLRHHPGRVSFWSTLSYFFLLPNVCFPLFPVVDYKTFRTTYYRRERHQIYATGVQWIFRGVLHLLLYRLIYRTMVIAPTAVTDALDVVQYMAWPFLLYLRVSGQFHVVVGILKLFGFDLPETHREYFLTSSFTDFWRRINIYWKDFMMKLFYYPAYFALRKRGETAALVVSTTLVFVVTWLLHSYQWFWLRGSFLFAWNDALFWTLLGGAVVVNTLREWRHGRHRSIAPQQLTWQRTLALAGRTVAMFVCLSLLWSLWTTESIAIWLALWPALLVAPDAVRWQEVVALMIPVGIGLLVIARARSWLRAPALSPVPSGIAVVAASAVLVAASTSSVAASLGPAGTTLVHLRFGGLNQVDAVAMERGYYENLMGVDRFNGELWALYMNRPVDWQATLQDKGLARETGGFVPYELTPSAAASFKGAMLRTNAWGMHDREYAIAPAEGCRRIAVLGASHAMGSGVERERTFEALLEARLNRELQGQCVEVLNFSVYGYSPLHQLEILTSRVLRFKPDAVLYVGHPEDSQRVVRVLTQYVRRGVPIPFEFLRGIVAEAGVVAEQSEVEIAQRLDRRGERILAGLYGAMTSAMRAHGICGGFVFLPMVPDMKYATDVGREKALPAAAGFAVFDLSDVYNVSDRNGLWIAEWDAHPNARGHQLVADRLYSLLREQQALLGCRSARLQ